tara:strand:- start:336 stop:1703 length:1368 start_codon:yes stop_codon:yes gene_type:complete
MKKLILIFFLIIQTNYVWSQIISYELAESWSKEDVSSIYTQYGIPESAGAINYPVDGYKILYFTPDYNGDLVICSGAIFLPSGIGCSPPILSWQHGTESNNEGAPSNVGNSYNDLMGVVGAANGYIVTMSDFIGLGEGEGVHNYVHADTQASSIIDLIIYGKDFATDMLGITPNEQLFLFGYSQGGHATMAAVKEIETNYTDQLTITASCPMAGPYSMSGAQRLMLESGEPYPNPGYLPYVLFAYDKIYNLYDNISDVLKSPYSDSLYEMYDGSYDMWEINYEMWSIGQEIFGISPTNFTPIQIFEDEYYQEYLKNDNHPFKVALADNDVYDFIPQSSMLLLHCNGDDNVAYENSEIAYNYFIKNGAQDVQLEDLGSFTHTECANIAILGAKIWIDTMAELCEPTNIEETIKTTKKIICYMDFLGRHLDTHQHKASQNTITIYSDGSFDKNFKIE